MTKARVVKSQPLGDDYYCIKPLCDDCCTYSRDLDQQETGKFCEKPQTKTGFVSFFFFFLHQGRKTMDENKRTHKQQTNKHKTTRAIERALLME
jgi:hypothetical protein